MNKVLLMGRLGRDPETRAVGSTTVTKFSLATSEQYKDKNGEKQESTQWHNVVFWGASGENLAKFFKAGDGIFVEGSVTYSKAKPKDSDKEITYTDIKGHRWEFTPGKKAGEGATSTKAHHDAQPSAHGYDDLPF